MYEIKEARIQLREGLPLYSSKAIKGSKDVAKLLMSEMAKLDRENIWALNLDNKLKVINYTVVAIGSIDSAPCRNADVFKAAILSNAKGIILAHNHPSGDPEPSKYDFEVTESLIASGKLLGIQVLDHLVIGNKKYYSFNEEHPEMF
ncbi:DNA repair protein RadC [Oribacterium sp. KHPX15]|uniref:JAB domain-containing protein n=1 Tax=Oribacterium sp. KHPX15 TaxID=1855342 RepID=UPI00089544DB|nr:JAB domain-containing protein [Oribacterium sp. KHPX15]SEA88894.1 DNA repair protein RadC [Oribacterium sp. KHPX15]